MQEAEERSSPYPTLSRLTEVILKNGEWIWLEEKSSDNGESWAQFGVFEHERVYIAVYPQNPRQPAPSQAVGVSAPVNTPPKYVQRYNKCPECNSPDITIEAGCPTCHICGWSKC